MLSISSPIRLLAVGVFLSALALAGCNKHQGVSPVPGVPVPGVPGGQPSITGKWALDSVTNYFYNADGTLRNGGVQVSADPGYFMQFNADHSWVETYPPSYSLDNGTGTYTLPASDSTFTLTIPKAIQPDLACKVLSLTGNTFVYHWHELTTYDGRVPGYVEHFYYLRK